MTAFVCLALAFLLGSLPFGYWLPLWLRHQDVRQMGSKNPGFSNVMRLFGWRLGVPVLVLDVAKGFSGSVLGLCAGNGSLDWGMAGGLLAVTGHMFSPFLRGRGGKGIATGLGALTPIYRSDLWLPLLAFFIGYSATRYVSLGSVLATFAFALISFSWKPYNTSIWIVSVSTVLSLAVIYKHRDNLSRILSGTERRL